MPVQGLYVQQLNVLQDAVLRPPLTSHFQVEDVESGLQSELCKQRWLLNLIGGVESSYQDTILDLHEERVRL